MWSVPSVAFVVVVGAKCWVSSCGRCQVFSWKVWLVTSVGLVGAKCWVDRFGWCQVLG